MSSSGTSRPIIESSLLGKHAQPLHEDIPSPAADVALLSNSFLDRRKIITRSLNSVVGHRGTYQPLTLITDPLEALLHLLPPGQE
jgi:hypothetical protein